MKKLSKEALADKAEIVKSLTDKKEALEKAMETFNAAAGEEWTKLEAALAEYNAKVAEAWAPVDEAISALNSEITRANEWKGEQAGIIEEYIGERSEKWQEGEKGDAYSSWKGALEGDDIEEVSLDQPEELTLDQPDELTPDLPDVDAFESLPDQPDGA